MAPVDKKGNRKKQKGNRKSKREAKKVDMQINQPLKMNWELAEKTRAKKRNREKLKAWRKKNSQK